MKRIVLFSFVFLTASLVLLQCKKVPVTNRAQLILIPESELIAMSNEQYRDFVSKSVLSTDTAQVNMVKRIGARIQKAVEKYMADNKMSSRLYGYKWEFNLVESNQVNAWCMPGGKVVVYTGIMEVAKDEAGLAVVMGHEIAHAIARHGNERMSQQMVAQFGATGIGVAMQQKSQTTRSIFNTAYGVGSGLGTLSYSRKHESEADHLGLIFMAMAGYDPGSAVPFWERMAQLGGGGQPELLSTHPSDQRRIEDIQKELPEAMEYYKKSKQ